ncbi:hypothetical protein pb186bvf_015004 [Paramecium bursaria]
MQNSQMSKELNVFLDLLHNDQNDKIYENYLFGGDLDDLEQQIQKMTQQNIQQQPKELSVIYSATESESSTHRDSYLSEIFTIIYKDFQQAYKSQKFDKLKECEHKIRQLQTSICQYIGKLNQNLLELSDQNNQYEANNKLLIETLTSAQQEIQILQKKNDDNIIIKLKKQVQEFKKNYEEQQNQLQKLLKENDSLTKQLQEQDEQFKECETEFRDASNRLIKSNQALREIIVNMGNLSPLNQSKLKEVLNYLTTNNSDQRAKSTGKRNRETNASFYATQNSQRQSTSPQNFNSNRKPLKDQDQNKFNILDSTYQTSYKELFLKSLKKGQFK